MLNFPCSPELRVAPSHRTGLAFHAAMLKHQVVKYDHADESDGPQISDMLLAQMLFDLETLLVFLTLTIFAYVFVSI